MERTPKLSERDRRCVATTDWVLSQFGSHSDKARVRYAKFVMDRIGELRREEFHTGSAEGRLLGGDGFIEKALRKAN